MKKVIRLFLLSLTVFVLGCSEDDDPATPAPEITLEAPEDGFDILITETLLLKPTVKYAEGASYLWRLDGKEVSTDLHYEFKPELLKEYTILLTVMTNAGNAKESVQIKVNPAPSTPPTANSSPYITQIFDYQYAPGQHAQSLAAGKDGTDFIGNTSSYVLLGGWGGYITAGFDHTVANQNSYDFGVYTQPGTGSEPGVVYVMKDLNGDGQPNDGEWYELKGSEFSHQETIRNYEVTYSKPTNASDPVTWQDNQGNSGSLVAGFGSGGATWWWDANATQVTFQGTKLPDSHYNANNNGGQYWTNYPDRFVWGYAENYQGSDHDANLKANLFDISNAVDAQGQPVTLTGIDFIKVQSGVFQVAGWLNEISTEVRGAFDVQLVM
ncbi:PKD-like domain-containing protein [Rapidithrix thailandica]|uniref:PKD-like domain-containing protein n=1 Tax=Rapidithrix thailandica TaxID=413964 RepID=A0AAW9S263_9BACT